MHSQHRLPLTFDVPRLQADLARIGPEEWVPHFNTGYYQGDWSGVSLRSVGGRPSQLYPDPTAAGAFADTELLARCPYVRQVLASLACPLDSARFLKLGPGASIREHRDFNLGFADGEVRLHIPVTTNPEVDFLFQGERIEMQPGETWFLDFNQKHAVVNRGATPRVHLVVDCHLNEWLRARFPPEWSA